MPLILPGNVASATASTTYDVANSCKFDGVNGYMSFTPDEHMNMDRWTFSAWVKRSKLGAVQTIFNADNAASDLTELQFDANDKLHFENLVSNSIKGDRVTTRAFRDTSAWYHIVVVWDSGNATAGDRIKIYINGSRETSFSSDDNPDQNTDSSFGENNIPIRLGTLDESAAFFSGYMAEVLVLDGTAASIGDLGEFDEDSPQIWKPKDVSGLTFGTEGFYLDFEDSGDLGDDESGNTNDFTESNLAATDQATDTPTNNFCTMNPLANYFPASTFSEGNCKIVTASSPYTYNIGTFGLTSGKWYWEIKYVAADGDPHNVGHFGISGKGDPTANSHPLGYYSTDYGIHAESGGTITNNNSGTTNSLYNIAIGNILGFGLDLDSGTHTLKFLVNGTDKIDTNISSSPESGAYFPAFGFTYSAGTGTFEANFGGCSAFTVSSGNADANGYGNFEYSVPSGYLSLCTKNLGSDGG